MIIRMGQQLGNYRLIRPIGHGGFSDVYLGQHLFLNSYAAVKVLHVVLNDKQVKDFLTEAQTQARLAHPHIVRILDFAVEAGIPFLVMDYLPNGALRQRHPMGSSLPLDTVVSYVKQIAEALQYAHDHYVIHRDVKPENLLLGPRNEVILTDFGIATIAHNTLSMSTQNGAGTMAYMAPEQINRKPRPASDQYALGIVTYEWLCGELPFNGTIFELYNQHLNIAPPRLSEKDPSIPVAVEAVVLKALAKNWQQRFTNIQEFAVALEQASRMAEASQTPVSSKRNATLPMAPVLPPVDDLATLRYPILAPSATHLTGSSVTSLTAPYPAQGKFPVPHNRHSKRSILLIVLALAIMASFGLLSPTVVKWITSPPITLTTRTASSGLSGFVDAPMFGFDSQHTHFNPNEYLVSSTDVSRLTLDWAAITDDHIFSSPAVANGVVYFGSLDHKLYAYSAAGCGDGKLSCPPLWVSDPTGDHIYSSPAIANGAVFVGSENGHLYAYNAAGCGSGKLSCPPLWVSYPTGPIFSSPAVANGIVYIGTDDSKLYAYNAAGCGSGKLSCPPIWVSNPTGDRITSSPAVANGIVYVGSLDHKLYAYNAAGCGRGKLSCPPIWVSDPTGDAIDASSPAVANGIVYVGSYDHKLYAYNAAGCGSGKLSCPPIWVSNPTGDRITSSPAVANGIVYVGSLDHKLYAYNAAGCGSGKLLCSPLWVSDPTGDVIFSSPAVANGVVYIGSYDRKLYAYNAAGCGRGKLYCPPLWVSDPAGDVIASSPVVVNGMVYVGSFDGELYTFHIKSR